MEIGAGILPPWVEKTLKQSVSQIIVMRYIAARLRFDVQMVEHGSCTAASKRYPASPVTAPALLVQQQQFHE